MHNAKCIMHNGGATMKKKYPILMPLLMGFLALLISIVSLAVNPRVIFSQAVNPWETAQGQACFEKWISESMAKLNAYNGNADFNARKPWSINKYGVLEGNAQFGPRSVAAPDNFPQYNNNKYWWMWDNWIPVNADGTWRSAEWNGAGIENIRTYVTKCTPGPVGNTNTGGGGGNPPPSGGNTAQGGGLTVPGVDNDSANTLWNCETSRARFGDEGYDKSRCFTFRYTVPSGGIQSAMLHLAVNPLEPSTDALVFAIATMHPNCAWTADIPCVAWGEPIPPNVTALDRDLINFNPADAKAQILNELNKGVLHVMLQDDTTVYCAQLIINGGDGTPLCTKENSNPSGGGGPTGQFVLRTSKDVYATNEEITVDFSGLDTNAGNWITIAQASAKPENYGQWQWTGGKPSGALSFSPHAAGNYEARLFLNWPSGGYTVAARYPFRVEGTGTGGMVIEAPRRLALPNDLLLIPITLRNAANVANLNFDVEYTANVIRPEGDPLKGNLLDNALFSSNPTTQPGLIRNGFAQTSGLAGTGIVVNIPFRIIGKPGDKSPLNLNVTTVNEPNGGVLQIERIAGEILITNPDGTLPGGGGTGGGTGGTGGTGGAGGIPPGDCDGDLRVTELDALCALEMSVQLRDSLDIMDIDNSGLPVTSRDAVIILQRAVGQ